jgi:DNA polymerase-3 subunit delta'
MWQVSGQDMAVNFLEKALTGGRLGHAYLLVGPHQIGKTTLAIDLAKAVNCLNSSPPCNNCTQCSRIQSGIHADVQIIDSSLENAEIGIDRVRETQRSASLKPFEGRCRVFIFAGAERLSREASTALLKTLEEPASDTLLILTSAREDDLLPTIMSRCTRLELRRLPYHHIQEVLVIKYSVDNNIAKELAQLSLGCIGWAINASQDPEFLPWMERERERVADLVESGLEDRFVYAADLAALYPLQRTTGARILNLWLHYWRDLLLIVADSTLKQYTRQNEVALKRQALRLTKSQIASTIEAIYSTMSALDQHANPRLALDIMMLDIPKLASLDSHL